MVRGERRVLIAPVSGWVTLEVVSVNATTFSRQVPACMEELHRLCQEFRAHLEGLGVGDEVTYALQLTLEELASNSVKYGCKERPDGWVRVTLQTDELEFALMIEDNGAPFDPLEAPPPKLTLPDCDRRPGGLGLHLVRHFADRFYYERVADTNRVVFVKGCPTD